VLKQALVGGAGGSLCYLYEKIVIICLMIRGNVSEVPAASIFRVDLFVKCYNVNYSDP
jgi:hypothetical protein